MSQTINEDEVLTSEATAKLLGLDPRYFAEKFIFKMKDFPKAFRYNGRGHRHYLRGEVVAWRETQREAA